jgi:hypothetical protein
MLRWLRRGDQPSQVPGGWRWPPNRPTGPTTASGSCASTSNSRRLAGS